MQFETCISGDGICILTPLENRIDVHLAQAFRAALIEQIDRGSVNMIVDLTRVEFIDSSGLGALVSAVKHLGNAGELKVSGLRDAVRSMFELTRLNRVIPIAEVPIVKQLRTRHVLSDRILVEGDDAGHT